VARFAINKSFYATNVSFPGSVGTSVGVGYFDTKADTFSAEITFCHSGTSFVLSESQRSYYNKVSQKMQAFISNFSEYFDIFLILNDSLCCGNKKFTALL